MVFLYLLTGGLLVASAIGSRDKTFRALKVASRRFMKMAPAFVVMLVFVATALHIVPRETMERVLAADNRWVGMVGAIGLGSVSIMPGFIAFPLCGILLSRGAAYMVLAAFSTTLMMVGIVTFPLERMYLGTRLAVARNAVSLLVAIATALAIGWAFGELL